MIQFLKDKMSSISSDFYKEILEPNKVHTNCIIEIIPCKTTLSFKSNFFTEYPWAIASADAMQNLLL